MEDDLLFVSFEAVVEAIQYYCMSPHTHNHIQPQNWILFLLCDWIFYSLLFFNYNENELQKIHNYSAYGIMFFVFLQKRTGAFQHLFSDNFLSCHCNFVNVLFATVSNTNVTDPSMVSLLSSIYGAP